MAIAATMLSAPQEGGAAPRPTGGAAAGIRCLLVQPAPTRAAITRLSAEASRPIALTLAESAREAEAVLEAGGIDVVLLDPVLPDGDGLGLLADLRRDPRHAGLPVIIISANGGSEHVVRAMRGGAQDYLVCGALTVNGLERAIMAALQGDPATARDDRARLAELAHEVATLRRTAGRNMRLMKAQAMPLLAFAWKSVSGPAPEEAEQPRLAHRLARLTRSLVGMIDETAILAATEHGRELPVPVDLGHLVHDLIARDTGELRASAAHVRCGPLPRLMARRSHMVLLMEELLLNAVRASRFGTVPDVELGWAPDPDGNPVVWMTEDGLPLSTRKQTLGRGGADLVEPVEAPESDPHIWSLCQRLAEKNRGAFRIAEHGDAGCRVMIRFAREMLL